MEKASRFSSPNRRKKERARVTKVKDGGNGKLAFAQKKIMSRSQMALSLRPRMTLSTDGTLSPAEEGVIT